MNGKEVEEDVVAYYRDLLNRKHAIECEVEDFEYKQWDRLRKLVKAKNLNMNLDEIDWNCCTEDAVVLHVEDSYSGDHTTMNFGPECFTDEFVDNYVEIQNARRKAEREAREREKAEKAEAMERAEYKRLKAKYEGGQRE